MYRVVLWGCYIPTLHNYDIFPPGGNLLGNQRIIMNTSIHVDEGIQFSEHRKADNSKEKLQIKKFQQFLETIQREKWTRCFYLGWVGINNFGQRQQLTFLRFRIYIWIQTGAIISLIVSFETHPQATVLK